MIVEFFQLVNRKYPTQIGSNVVRYENKLGLSTFSFFYTCLEKSYNHVSSIYVYITGAYPGKEAERGRRSSPFKILGKLQICI